MACVSCHGADLRSLGEVPRLAGQMPTYLARQMWDIKFGSRTGIGVTPMINVVAKLKPNDIRLAAREP
jgi:cytochrome c553